MQGCGMALWLCLTFCLQDNIVLSKRNTADISVQSWVVLLCMPSPNGSFWVQASQKEVSA